MEVISIPSAYERMEAYTLYSGSKGNSVFIRCGTTQILIDAGMSARATESALLSLGSSLANISAVFITHEHSDHIRGLDVMTRRYNPEMTVHAVGQTASCCKCRQEQLYGYPPCFSVEIGSLSVNSFPTPHDSLCSVGYIVRNMDSGCSVGIATDMGYMPDSILEQLADCRGVILESNHDVDMLMKGPYPPELKTRILSRRGHLSNADCASAVRVLAQNGVKHIMLAHLSEENNTPDLARAASMAALEEVGISDIALEVASQNCVKKLL